MGITEIAAGAGAVLGLVGTVLGVLSNWAGLTRVRPRLKVRPIWTAWRTADGYSGPFRFVARRGDLVEQFPDGQFGIEVVNIGFVTVRVREVGFCPLRTTFFQRFREFPEPEWRGSLYEDADGEITLPHELEPGARFVMTSAKSAIRNKYLFRARSVYAITEADKLFIGKGRVLGAFQAKAIRDAVAIN